NRAARTVVATCVYGQCEVCFTMFFFSSRRRHTRSKRDWSSDVCSSDLNHRFKDLIATPVVETMPDMWLLGTGSGSARTAAENGMAYAFAHFAPYFRSDGLEIIHRYRNDFIPSSFLQEPKVMIAVLAIIEVTI